MNSKHYPNKEFLLLGSLGPREDELAGFCVFIFLVVLAQQCIHIYYLAVAEMFQS